MSLLPVKCTTIDLKIYQLIKTLYYAGKRSIRIL